VMDLVTAGESLRFDPPSRVEARRTCALSGLTPGPHCPSTLTYPEPAERAVPATCTWHAECGVRWPAEYLPWAAAKGLAGSCEGPSGGGIAYPTPGAVLYVDPRLPADSQRVPLRAAASPQAAATWRVDGEVIAEVNAAESAMWAPQSRGEHVITLELDGAPADSVQVTVGGVTAGGD
jgi:membrane carboxypeptidase/penicillin-binding protein PbpC